MSRKRICITGCGSGLGNAMLNYAREKGYHVLPHYRTSDVKSKNYVVGDITDVGFADYLNSYLQIHNIDVFINNAGIYLGKEIENCSDDEIANVINTNVTAQIQILKRVYSRFRKMKSGLIININSLAFQQPSKNETVYAASKYALKGFSKALQMEAIGTGVDIIDVHPGGIQTRMTQSRDNYNSMMDVDEVAKKVIDLTKRGTFYTNELVLRKRNACSRP